MKTLAIVSGAAMCAAILVAPAGAQPAPSHIVTEVGVAYSDLDLTSEEGARAMLDRLETAAAAACGGKPSPVMPGDAVGLAKLRAFRACKAAAIDNSTLDLGSAPVRAAWLAEQRPSGARREPDSVAARTAEADRAGGGRNE